MRPWLEAGALALAREFEEDPGALARRRRTYRGCRMSAEPASAARRRDREDRPPSDPDGRPLPRHARRGHRGGGGRTSTGSGPGIICGIPTAARGRASPVPGRLSPPSPRSHGGSRSGQLVLNVSSRHPRAPREHGGDAPGDLRGPSAARPRHRRAPPPGLRRRARGARQPRMQKPDRDPRGARRRSRAGIATTLVRRRVDLHGLPLPTGTTQWLPAPRSATSDHRGRIRTADGGHRRPVRRRLQHPGGAIRVSPNWSRTAREAHPTVRARPGPVHRDGVRRVPGLLSRSPPASAQHHARAA